MILRHKSDYDIKSECATGNFGVVLLLLKRRIWTFTLPCKSASCKAVIISQINCRCSWPKSLRIKKKSFTANIKLLLVGSEIVLRDFFCQRKTRSYQRIITPKRKLLHQSSENACTKTESLDCYTLRTHRIDLKQITKESLECFCRAGKKYSS